MNVQITDWKPLQLTVDGVGPFQNGPRTLSFAGEPTEGDPDPEPSNLYMLLAENGHGKTTLLECVYGLFGMLAKSPVGRFVTPGDRGRAQLDVRATWTIDGRTQTMVLSIWTGTDTPLVVWSSDELKTARASTNWAQLGLKTTYDGISLANGTDTLGRRLYDSILKAQGKAPGTLFGTDQDMPSVLLFPADRRAGHRDDMRRIERPSELDYQPAHCFESDGPEWNTTIDNLLLWLDWLDDGRLQELLSFVNPRLFEWGSSKAIRPPRRQELLTDVSTPTGDHPLADLSHGERALLQLYVRIACSMTSNTIVLIDEVNTHLHSKRTFQLLAGLKALLRKAPSLSIVFTTHNREIIRAFDHRRKEEGVVKGGYLIKDETE